MNICFICSDMQTYGEFSKSNDVYVAENLAQLGHSVTVITYKEQKYKDNQTPDGMSFIVMDLIKNILTEEQREQLGKSKFDFVFCTSINLASLTTQISQLNKCFSGIMVLDIPTWRLQNSDKYLPWRRQWAGWLKELESIDIIFANTSITTKYLNIISDNNLKERIISTNYGIDIKEIEKILPQEKENSILYVGSLVYHKGLDLLLYSLSLIENAPTLHIIGAGHGDEKSYFEKGNQIPFRYSDMAYLLGVKCVFYGGLDNDSKFTLMKKSKLCVLPQYTQTVPSIVPLESVYCGTPCLVNDTEINRENLGDTVIFAKDIGDTRQLADKITSCLTDDFQQEFNENQNKFKEWIRINRSTRRVAMDIHRGIMDLFSFKGRPA